MLLYKPHKVIESESSGALSIDEPKSIYHIEIFLLAQGDFPFF